METALIFELGQVFTRVHGDQKCSAEGGDSALARDTHINTNTVRFLESGPHTGAPAAVPLTIIVLTN